MLICLYRYCPAYQNIVLSEFSDTILSGVFGPDSTSKTKLAIRLEIASEAPLNCSIYNVVMPHPAARLHSIISCDTVKFEVDCDKRIMAPIKLLLNRGFGKLTH